MSRTGQFKKGNVPFNKGKRLVDYMSPRGVRNSSLTRFKKGQLPHNTKSKGTITREMTHGALYYTINIDWRGRRKYHNSYKWYLWEVAHQQDRPKGRVLAVRDGNPNNIKLDNLELITRAELLRRNRVN